MSGKCRHGQAVQARPGARPGAGREWHAECPGHAVAAGGVVLRCECRCHGAARDVRQEIAAAKRMRLVAAGIDPDAGSRRSKERGFCRHDHEMTPENTGPRGECRECKRVASARCKARRSERKQAESGDGLRPDDPVP